MDTNAFAIKRETKKALLLTEDGKDYWIQRRWLREDGTLTAKGQESRARAVSGEDSGPKRKPFLKIKYAELRDISDKAVVVTCYDGSSDVLPTSQLRIGYDFVLVPCWLAQQKTLQFAQKKVWGDV